MKNWRTTWSAAGAAVMSLLTFVAIAPYELEGVGTLIPPKYKATLAIASAVAALILKVINGTQQKDKNAEPSAESPKTKTNP